MFGFGLRFAFAFGLGLGFEFGFGLGFEFGFGFGFGFGRHLSEQSQGGREGRLGLSAPLLTPSLKTG